VKQTKKRPAGVSVEQNGISLRTVVGSGGGRDARVEKGKGAVKGEKLRNLMNIMQDRGRMSEKKAASGKGAAIEEG
jgi:hypothetical protein